MEYRPEGFLFGTQSNQKYISSPEGLSEAMKKGIILEAKAVLCTSSHDLVIDLPCATGTISRTEGAIGIEEGKTRDIALISRVNKIVCFKIKKLEAAENGELKAVLSRRTAQEECLEKQIKHLKSGDIIDAKVSHLEQFGSFVDIGCGIPSLIPIDCMSVSRISSPSDRFYVGQNIKAVVTDVKNGRVFLSHKELLGTWEENAAKFKAGETVPGIVRSVEDYGIFVELSPNLAGLTETREGISTGQSVSVYIKAVIPEKMKIKLVIVDTNCEAPSDTEYDYFIKSGHIDQWVYSSERSGKLIQTVFR